MANTPRIKGILVAVEGIDGSGKDHSSALVDGEITEPRSGRDFAFLTMMMCSDKLFSAQPNLPGGWLRPDMSRRRFLVLEGPAGVGKTTLLPLVCAELAGMGMQAVAMPEFCSGPLGDYLRDEALQDKRRMQRQLNGLPSLLAFLTSRAALLAEVSEREGDVVVCDRFFPTEILHALHDLAETGEQLAGSAIIAAILRWADHFLAPDSLIVRLVAADNRLRLEQRLGCVLDQHLLDWCLSSERRYETLPDLGLPWEVTTVPNDMPPQTVARDIRRIALERWQRP